MLPIGQLNAYVTSHAQHDRPTLPRRGSPIGRLLCVSERGRLYSLSRGAAFVSDPIVKKSKYQRYCIDIFDHIGTEKDNLSDM